VNRLGMGIMGVVDDGCNCFLMTDGGYEITQEAEKHITLENILRIIGEKDTF
jgi:hypothetical protein